MINVKSVKGVKNFPQGSLDTLAYFPGVDTVDILDILGKIEYYCIL